jgi:PadR family transcriptional regulator PadR
MRGELLKGHLDLLLLATVQSGAAHGYVIIEELYKRSGGAFKLPEGTVYPALHRLEHAGLLSSTWSEEAGRRRRVYELTRQGRAALHAQEEDWRQFARGINGVLYGAPNT